MAQFSANALLVCPTQANVEGDNIVNGVGAGAILSEARHTSMHRGGFSPGGCVISGFTFPATTSGTLTVPITLGEALIDGYIIKGTGTQNITLSASTTHYLYLRLNYSAGLVVSAFFETLTTAVAPTGSALLGWMKTNGSEMTSSFAAQSQGFYAFGSIELETTLPHKIHASSSNWYTDTAGASQTTLAIKFPTALARAPRFIQAWVYPAAQWPGTIKEPALLMAKGQSTTEVTLQKTSGDFVDGDFVNFKIRA